MVEIDHGFTTDMKYAVAGTFKGGLSSKIYPLLKNEWYNVKMVYPVCPDKKEINGDPAFASLKDLPEPIDVVIVVHKKELTTEIVKEASMLNPKPSIWFMPRTDSKESIILCEENEMKYGMSCVMGHRAFPGIKRFINGHWWHSKVSGMNRIPKQ
ncbi:MAG: CoA-binding protein [Candidatus Hodarchaeales archaeon]|jgi:predicted CoA-binding protein